MPREPRRGTCIAQGTHDGVAWACDRPVASGGLCEGHRKARQRGRPMLPLREHLHGPIVELTIRISAEDRAQLGVNAEEHASAIVRAALARRRPRAAAQPQLRLGLVPKGRAR